jgi:hypothetical protein
MSDTVVCSTCGKSHPKEETELVLTLPGPIFDLTADERDARCDFSDDVCALDRSRFFVRGLLPLPVHGRDHPYRIGLWAEVAPAAFERICRLWSDPKQADEPPIPAILANDVPTLPSSVGVEVDIRLTGPTTRPDFILKPSDHPLSLEQRRGIDAHRALEFGTRQISHAAS